MTDSPFYMSPEEPLHFPPARDVIGAPVDLVQYTQDRIREAWMEYRRSPASVAFLKQHAVIARRT